MRDTSAASELTLIVGEDLMAEICEAFGGQTIYIPSRVPDFTRDFRIQLEFNEALHTATTAGSAYIQVAQQEGISPRTVQRVILGA